MPNSYRLFSLPACVAVYISLALPVCLYLPLSLPICICLRICLCPCRWQSLECLSIP